MYKMFNFSSKSILDDQIYFHILQKRIQVSYLMAFVSHYYISYSLALTRSHPIAVVHDDSREVVETAVGVGVSGGGEVPDEVGGHVQPRQRELHECIHLRPRILRPSDKKQF